MQRKRRITGRTLPIQPLPSVDLSPTVGIPRDPPPRSNHEYDTPNLKLSETGVHRKEERRIDTVNPTSGSETQATRIKYKR